MAQRRELRVRELLKREIGEAIRRLIPIAEAGLISVNDVGVASDLRNALVFISVLGSQDQRKRIDETMARYSGTIQTIVAQRVRMKFTPRLYFRVDDSVAEGDRVLAILTELERAGGPGASAPPPAPKPGTA